MNLIETFQNLVAQVPDLVQPLIVSLAGAVPFIEGEGAAGIGIIGGIPPVIAAVGGASPYPTSPFSAVTRTTVSSIRSTRRSAV